MNAPGRDGDGLPRAIDFKSLAFPKDRQSLTVAEVAHRLSISEQHVHDLIDEGQLQAWNAGGGVRNHWRIPIEAYNDFLQSRHSFNVLRPHTQFSSGTIVPRGTRRGRPRAGPGPGA